MSSAAQGKSMGRPRGELGLVLEPDDDDAIDMYLLNFGLVKILLVDPRKHTSPDPRNIASQALLYITCISLSV